MGYGANMRVSLGDCVKRQLTLVDYILFTALDVKTELNLNEVSDAKYVSKEELEEMFRDQCGCSVACARIETVLNPANSFTPWFRLIARDLLFPWWDEMFAKSKAEGWDGETGKGVVRASTLANGDKVDEIIRML